jgi:pyruvate-ferredoxin/flavodoxin oxidoreductase
MYIANATGCSSIWGGSAPSTPYTTNEKGFGPAWANSLFEDNAEYGFGMYTAVKQIRERVKDLALSAIESGIKEESKAALQEWVDNMDKTAESKAAAAKVVEALKAEDSDICKEILDNKEHLVKKSQWIFGGDGWAYDIGFGGLDHVLASGEDVNIFVFDTEVYSNTGGQSSKSTPAAAVAQFAASGKKVKKKDLGMIAMSYGYVYVAQVGMGANQKQLIDALIEAESYPGPSLIIAYAPCINHGLKVGMGCTQLETKLAVEAGYWHLYRYNPLLAEQGKNPFILDSKDPTGSFRDFILSEVRYSSLARSFPEIAEQLFEKAEKDAQYRLKSYKTLANNN